MKTDNEIKEYIISLWARSWELLDEIGVLAIKLNESLNQIEEAEIKNKINELKYLRHTKIGAANEFIKFFGFIKTVDKRKLVLK